MADIVSAIGKVLIGFDTGTGETAVHTDGFVDWFVDISNMLLANDIVKFILAIAIILIVVGVVMKLVSKIRGRKKRR
jgi:hypothetical protein